MDRNPGGVPIVGESKSDSGGSGGLSELGIGDGVDGGDDNDADDEDAAAATTFRLAGVRVANRVTVGDATSDDVGVASGVGRNSEGSGGCGDDTKRAIEATL